MITGVQNLIYFVEVDLIALLQEPAAKTEKKVTITASVAHVPPDHLTTVVNHSVPHLSHFSLK